MRQSFSIQWKMSQWIISMPILFYCFSFFAFIFLVSVVLSIELVCFCFSYAVLVGYMWFGVFVSFVAADKTNKCIYTCNHGQWYAIQQKHQHQQYQCTLQPKSIIILIETCFAVHSHFYTYNIHDTYIHKLFVCTLHGPRSWSSRCELIVKK